MYNRMESAPARATPSPRRRLHPPAEEFPFFGAIQQSGWWCPKRVVVGNDQICKGSSNRSALTGLPFASTFACDIVQPVVWDCQENGRFGLLRAINALGPGQEREPAMRSFSR